MIPSKLKTGDEIRIIAPSKSLGIISREVREIARRRLEAMGFRVTISKHAEEMDRFRSSSAESRLEDLHQAFADPKVKGILTAIGGYNCNQLLKNLDYDLIRKNPKVFCGYSDITALQNAIYAKTGLVTYSGPHFSSFGMKKGFEYTMDSFRKCLMDEEPFPVRPSPSWSDDLWFQDQENRRFIPNGGWFVLSPGEARGKVIGGNLSTFVLLHGTEYLPDLADAILFLEDDGEVHPELFDRYLQSLLQQPGFDRVKGLVIGRFQRDSRMSRDVLASIIRSKPELTRIPVVADLDFGHTTPIFTFPIGGQARLTAREDGTELIILTH
ncbi:S66 family peptidase [Planifilum fimeticola]